MGFRGWAAEEVTPAGCIFGVDAVVFFTGGRDAAYHVGDMGEDGRERHGDENGDDMGGFDLKGMLVWKWMLG